MTTQDKINQLAVAALRSGPPSPTAPKPATFMPSFEKLKSAEFVAGTATVAAPVAEAAPVAVKAAPAPAAAPAAKAIEIPEGHLESESELRSMLDARDDKKAKQHKRANIAVTTAMLLVFGTAVTWLVVSPTAHAKMNTLITAMKQSGKDIKGLATITGTYDKQLEKVAVQGARIDEATKALGIDPNGDTSAQGAAIDDATKQMSGGETTVADRDQKLNQKFGIVAKVAGRKTDKPAAESDVKF